MARDVTVYGLTTAADGYRVRYVGQTREIDRRLAEHLRGCGGRRRESAVKAWVRAARVEGREVILVVLWVGCAGAGEAEKFWIAALFWRGNDLLNRTPGGDGCGYNWANGRNR